MNSPALPHPRLRTLPALVACLLWTSSVAAQRDASVDRFRPAIDGAGFIGVPGTPTPGHLLWDAALSTGYVHRPLPRGAADPLPWRVGGDLQGALGLGERAVVAVGLPFVAHQPGERLPGETDDPPSAALVDPRVSLRGRVLGDTGVEGRLADGPGLGVSADVFIPAGGDEAFAGDGAVQTELGLTGDFQLLGAGAALRVGWLHRFSPHDVGGIRLHDAMTFAAALKSPMPFHPPLVAVLECRGSTDFEGESTTPVELDLGLRWTAGTWMLMAAGGLGLTDGLGAPDGRALLSLRYSASVDDEDGDGVPDDVDECRLLPEDLDGFEDEDGCEDPDNDNDLIPDVDDLCPNEEALEDQDDDEDGCTDGTAPR